MFTLDDFERVRNNKSSKSILDSILFSVQKNEFAYVMNLCNSHDRGHYTEKMVQNRLIDHNFKVIHCGEGGDFDLLINDSIRAEVKLATIQKPSQSKRAHYIFHKIKPECFDVIFLVFLNPYGMTIKWTNSEMFSEWTKGGYTRGKNGYQIRFDDRMNSKKLIYNETLESFTKTHLTLLQNDGILVKQEERVVACA